MSGKKKQVLSSVITVIVSLLVIVLAVGLIFKYTKAGEKIEDLINPVFRVEYNNYKYSDGLNAVDLPDEGYARFKVRGTEFYSIRVTSYVTPETDFTYEIGNTVYTFGKADFTKLFVSDSSIQDGYFLIDCSQDFSIESMLSKLHDGAEIKLNGNAEFPYMITFSGKGKAVKFIFGGKRTFRLSDSNIIF